MTMTSMSRRELKAAGYEVISSTIAYTPRYFLDENKETVLKDRKSIICARGCDQLDSHEREIYAATPPIHIVRIILILATECRLRPQQADVESAFHFVKRSSRNAAFQAFIDGSIVVGVSSLLSAFGGCILLASILGLKGGILPEIT